MHIDLDLVEVVRAGRVVYRSSSASHVVIFLKNCAIWFGQDWLKNYTIEDGDAPIDADVYLADFGGAA